MSSSFAAPFGFHNPSQLSFPQEQAGTLSTSISFQSVLKTPNYNPQYQEGEHFLQEQAKDYIQNQQSTLHHSYSPYTQPPPRKRPRPDDDMHLIYMNKSSSRNDDQDIALGSGYPQEESGNPASSIFQPFEHCLGSLCPPDSGYGSASSKLVARRCGSSLLSKQTKVYHPISPTSIYHTETTRAYSADLQSPGQTGLPHYPNMSSPRDEKTDFLLIADSRHMPEPLQDKYPNLQPLSTTNHPPAMQEEMQYNRADVRQFASGSEGSTAFLKTERSDQDFRVTDFPTGPSFNHHIGGSYSQPALTTAAMNSFPQHVMERYQAPQYSGPDGYVCPEAGRREQFEYVPVVASGGDLALMAPNQKPQATKRGPFKDLQKREKTAQVRKIGSCIRCRMQRIRVSRMRIREHWSTC